MAGAEIFEFHAHAKALEEWKEDQEDTDFFTHCKKAVMVALDRELTERQRRVYVMYYLDGISIPQIAVQLSVNKSTVSRTLKRATERLYRVMRYSTPRLLHAQAARRNRRENNGHS